MRRHSLPEVLTGALVLLIAAGFLAYAVANSGRSAGAGYTLFAKFDHIDGLGLGADVRIGGVKVGNVNQERLDPESFQAVVGLSVRNDIRLPKDSAAIVTSESLLGGKYLSLQPGGDETMLQPGQTDGSLRRYQTRLRNRNSFCVSAPTGQTSAAPMDQSLASGIPSCVQTSVRPPRSRNVSSPVPAISWQKRMQRVHWMQRVMSAMTWGPIIVRS